MVHRFLDARARPRRIPLDGSGRIIYFARADELSGYLGENGSLSPAQGIAGISHFASAWILPRSLLPNVAGYGRQNVAGAIDDRTGPREPPLPAKAASGAASDLAMRKKLDSRHRPEDSFPTEQQDLLQLLDRPGYALLHREDRVRIAENARRLQAAGIGDRHQLLRRRPCRCPDWHRSPGLSCLEA